MSSSDIQRCTDVALDNARIQFRFDNLESRPRLAVAAHPTAVAVTDSGDGPLASAVRFRMYANYAGFIERAEVRVFDSGQSVQAVPLAVVAVDDAGVAEWQPAAEQLAGPGHELKFLLRAYDAKGNFDETDTQPLWLNYETAREAVLASEGTEPAAGTPPRDTLAAYGENDLALHNIPGGSS